MKKITGELKSGHTKRECLLPKQASCPSSKLGEPELDTEFTWEASTPPLSYTRLW